MHIYKRQEEQLASIQNRLERCAGVRTWKRGGAGKGAEGLTLLFFPRLEAAVAPSSRHTALTAPPQQGRKRAPVVSPPPARPPQLSVSSGSGVTPPSAPTPDTRSPSRHYMLPTQAARMQATYPESMGPSPGSLRRAGSGSSSPGPSRSLAAAISRGGPAAAAAAGAGGGVMPRTPERPATAPGAGSRRQQQVLQHAAAAGEEEVAASRAPAVRFQEEAPGLEEVAAPRSRPSPFRAQQPAALALRAPPSLPSTAQSILINWVSPAAA